MVFKQFLTLAAATLVLSAPLTVFAADDKLDFGALGPSAPNGAPRVVEATYTQMSYENLYKLAWSYDAYPVGDEVALNNYLVITECKLFQKFFQNEFEWEKIKVATRKFIEGNKDKVPRYYEYVQPIYIGRYDYSLQGFPIIEGASEFKGQKNLQFARYQNGYTSCGLFNLEVAKFPSVGVLSISSPLNLSFIRVSASLAEKYIAWRENQGTIEDVKRLAYIRYRVRIDGYDGIKQFPEISNAFSFNGKLMRLDVFADQDLLLPLYNQVY